MAQKDKKNGKIRKAAAATNFPLLLYAAARMPQKVFKRRGPGSLPPSLIAHPQPLHPFHHSTETLLLSPTPNFSTFCPLLLCCNKIKSKNSTKNSTMNSKNSLRNLKNTR
jgi:hypothetical protein